VRAIFQKGKSNPFFAKATKNKSQSLGTWGEQVATEFLRGCGFQIIDRHWTARAAEIDIIAKDNDEYVFVEVKTRTSRRFGIPEASVSGHKAHHLIRSVELYRAKHKILDKPCRIDVIAIEKDRATGTHELRHLKAVL